MRAWVLTNGMAGFQAQALGVAEAMGLSPEVKRVSPRAPWRWFAPWGPAAPDPSIKPPWPDLLIASGRQAIPYARAIRRWSRGQTFVAILQDPRIATANFDFVWAPRHDQLSGPNVYSTLLSPNQVTPARLAREADRIRLQIAHLPHPRVAVLLGGANAVYQFDIRTTNVVGHSLTKLIDESRAGLMITPSRRTGEQQIEIIRNHLANRPFVMWDGTGENPYFGYLGNADAVIVTCDSINMIGEAIATGKPVYVFEFAGGSSRSLRFLWGVYGENLARPFAGHLEKWPYTPVNATAEIAEAIARAMSGRHSQSEIKISKQVSV